MLRRSPVITVPDDASSISSLEHRSSGSSTGYRTAAHVHDVTFSSEAVVAQVNDIFTSDSSSVSSRGRPIPVVTQPLYQPSPVADSDSDDSSTLDRRQTERIHSAVNMLSNGHSMESLSSAGYQLSSMSTRSFIGSRDELDSLDGDTVIHNPKHVRQNLAYKFRMECFLKSGGKYSRGTVNRLLSQFEPLRQEPSCCASDILSVLKESKFVRGNIIKPVYFAETEQGNVLFSVSNSETIPSTYYVCQICMRGFPTRRGIGDHTKSPSHSQSMKNAILEIQSLGSNGYCCPLLNCRFKSQNNQEVERHIKQDKVKELDTSTNRFKHSGEEYLWRCTVCNIMLPEVLRTQHVNGKKHQRNQIASVSRIENEQLKRDKNDVEITHVGENTITVTPSESKTVTLQIRNTSVSSAVRLLAYQLRYDIPSVIFSDDNDVYRSGRAHSIAPQGVYEVRLDVRPVIPGTTTIPVIFKFRRELTPFEIMSETLVNCVYDPSIHQLLQPTEPYQRPQREVPVNLEIIESDLLPMFENSCSLEMVLPLGRYFIPRSIKDLLRLHLPEDQLLIEMNGEELKFSNYSTHFSNLLHLEESQMEIDIKHYTMLDAQMRKDSRNNLIRLTVPGLAENRPSVLRGDRLYAIDGVRKYEGYVHDVQMLEVHIGFARRLRESIVDGAKYKIEFTINRLPHKVAHRAVEMAEHESYRYVLFPNPRAAILPPLRHGNPEDLSLRFCSSKIEANKEQKMAVQHIVCGTSRPSAYLIYGPPGTGKTTTLVEAIKQVYKEYPRSRILACAPQNAAADLVTERLLDHVDKKDIMRLHALSRPYSAVEDKVKEVSNYRSDNSKHSFKGGNKQIWFPSKEELMTKRILVVTLVTAGRLVSGKLADHFTHMFIDEAGHATEPETVIPIANLLNVNKKEGGQLVLAGDPKQLGPIIRSSFAVKGGLGTSMLERLMDCDAYTRDKTTNKFNPKYVTKLVQSFRSHPDILKVPNECFYDAELTVCANKEQRERFCHWEGLVTKGFPLIFHGVNGEEKREKTSPSWFNVNEIDIILYYVDLLMQCKSPKVEPRHIGIISPYHQQVRKITEGLKALKLRAGITRDYDKIAVGSVEKFQGDEREVIIISTVRSQDAYLTHDKNFNLGFVGNPKRFNVAVTRSKALLIVIGNPMILSRDRNWWKLIKHIKDGGGCRGYELPEDFETMSLSDNIDDMVQSMGQLSVDATGDEIFGHEEASAHQQLTDMEWRRNDA